MLSKRNIFSGIFLFFGLLGIHTIQAQIQKLGFHFKKEHRKKVVLNFKQYNNLVIVPLVLNKVDTLNFVLDTGVGHILITDPNVATVLKLKNYRNISVAGPAGNKKLEAFVSSIPKIKLGRNVQAINQEVIILKEAIPYLSMNAGIKIHGLIGFNLFNAFIIKINYITKNVTFYNYDKFRPKKSWKKLDIELESRKPYITAETIISEQSGKVPVKLLIDIGAAHSLSLEKGTHPKIQVPEKNIMTDLGTTINGEVTGNIARIDKFNLGNFEFRKVITSFPDSSSLKSLHFNHNRQGNLGCGVLQRFHIIFDYLNHKIYLKPNEKYKESFRDNTSGISLAIDYINFKDFVIADIRENSAASEVDLQIGDVVFSIDNYVVKGKNMGEVYDILNKEDGKRVELVVLREGKGIVVVNLTLKEMI